VTGPEHYQASERWLYKAQHDGARGPTESAESCALIAEVHALLAVAASYAEANPTSEWHKVAAPEVTP